MNHGFYSHKSPGDRLHRYAFGALAASPSGVRSRAAGTLFNRFYRLSDDPWGYSTDASEARRHAALVDACSAATSQWALDVGCGSGYLTRALLQADVAQWFVGIDISIHAVRHAGHHHLSLAQGYRTQFLQVDIANDGQYWFTDRFDLIVCADVLYYLPQWQLLSEVTDRLGSWMRAGGRLVLGHPVSQANYLHHAARSSPWLRAIESLHVGTSAEYRIDVFERAP